MQKWIVDNNIPHNLVDQLLKILKPRVLTSLPKSAKTFLKVKNDLLPVEPMESIDGSMGEFIHFGLKKI